MITITGLTPQGAPLTLERDWIDDDTFTAALLRGDRAAPGTLAAVVGSAALYTTKPSDEQVRAASVLAQRALRQTCARHVRESGLMRLWGQEWGRVLTVTVDAGTLRDARREAALQADDPDTD